MWKLSQEETFTENMKSKEAEYLCRLGEEWKKREEERQRVFTEKVIVVLICYTCACKDSRIIVFNNPPLLCERCPMSEVAVLVYIQIFFFMLLLYVYTLHPVF